MALNKESNQYIFIFSSVLVILVGAILAFLAVYLQPFQSENIQNEKKQNILQAIQVQVSRDEAEKAFGQYITSQLVLNYDAQVVGQNAFDIDIQKEYKSIADLKLRNYPLYVATKDNQTYYIIPLIGTGLWGPVWGFVALKADAVTIYGASFGHRGETPGLGAEITEPAFYNQFVGKKIADLSNAYVKLQVIKPGSAPMDDHTVDGITGGTLTSVGVEEMLNRILEVYHRYFKQLKSNQVGSEVVEQI